MNQRFNYNTIDPKTVLKNSADQDVMAHMSHLSWIYNVSFLSLYTARASFEYYRQVYFVHSRLQDESLQVTISKLP